MKKLSLIFGLLFFCNHLFSQDLALIVNKNNQTTEKIAPGDIVLFKLKNDSLIEAEISEISKSNFLYKNGSVEFSEIRKLRKRKKRTGQIVAGSALLVGGITVFALLSTGDTDFDDIPTYGAGGLVLTAAGVGLLIPNWYKIGKKFQIKYIQN